MLKITTVIDIKCTHPISKEKLHVYTNKIIEYRIVNAAFLNAMLMLLCNLPLINKSVKLLNLFFFHTGEGMVDCDYKIRIFLIKK